MQVLITIWFAVIGLCVGSFLNVVIARLPAEDGDDDEAADAPGEGDDGSWWASWKQALLASGRAFKRLAWPPSRCPRCGHQIRWYENVPVLSWLALRGKCSSCKNPISPRYVLVELLTGALFVAASARLPLDWSLVSALTFLTLLIPLIFIDAELWILPFELTLPGIAAGVLLAIPQGEEAWVSAAWGAVAGFLAFRVMEVLGFLATSQRLPDATGRMRVMGREALGAGDKYLLAMIGAALGARALLGVIFLSSIQGSVVGLIRLRLAQREAALEPPGSDPPQEADADEAPERLPFTPSFLEAGLPVWKRLVLVPVTLLFQDIPDAPPPDETSGEIPEWEPRSNHIPFGPFLGLAAIEVLLLRPWLVEHLTTGNLGMLVSIMFGG